MRHTVYPYIIAFALFGAVTICSPVLAQNAAEVIIVDKYAMNGQRIAYKCLDSSKCRKEDTDRDESGRLSITQDSPYDGKAIWHGSGDKHFTAAYADRYGINREDGTSDFDERKNTGTGTHTTYGPKGESYTVTIKTPPTLDLGRSFWANSIGEDTSANWTEVTCDAQGKNVISNSGIMEGYTYSTDSKKLLVIKGQSNRLYKVTLSAEAREWSLLNKKLARDSVGRCLESFNPRFSVTLGDVSCSAIKIANQKLNSNCQATISIPGNSSLEVTPKVNVPRYGYAVSVVSVVDAGPAPSPSSTPFR